MSAKRSSYSEKPPTFSEARLILVEGKDDQEVIAGLIDHLGLEGFQIHSMGGKPKWQANTKAITAAFDFQDNVRILAMVRDCDQSPAASWQSCADALKRSNLIVPDANCKLSPVGESGFRTAISLIPNRQDRGALEELLLPALNDDRMACVSAYMKCLDSATLSRSTTNKAIVQTYLAGLGQPARDLHIAVASGEINFAHSQFEEIRSLLVEMSTV